MLDEGKRKRDDVCDTKMLSTTASQVDDLGKTMQDLEKRFLILKSVQMPTSSQDTTVLPPSTSTQPISSSHIEMEETPLSTSLLTSTPLPKTELQKCKKKLSKCNKQLEECRITHWQSLSGAQYSATPAAASSITVLQQEPSSKQLSFRVTTPKSVGGGARPKRIRKLPDRFL